MRHRFRSLLLVSLAAPASVTIAANDVAGTLTTYRQNAGWCWFQDPRVVYTNGQLVIGSVAGTTNAYATGGDVYATAYTVSSGAIGHFKLNQKDEAISDAQWNSLWKDDHNAPAFSVLPGGRVLVEYATHGARDKMYWRVSSGTGSAINFGSQQTTDLNPVNDGNGVTYANPFYLSKPDKVFNFTRSVGYDTNYSVYSNLNATTPTHAYGGMVQRFVNPSSGQGPGRPYVKYAANGVDRIWFATTEDHPHNYQNSLYVGYMQFDASGAGSLHKADGTFVKTLRSLNPSSPDYASIAQPTAFTKIHSGNGTQFVAWANDMRLDEQGKPYVVYSTRNPTATDWTNNTIRYHYARFDGTTWKTNQIAFGGDPLYEAERNYAGLIAADPSAPNIVYISTNVDPVLNTDLISDADGQQHYELFKGVTLDNGTSWIWTALTSDSTVDNIRPVATALSDTQTSLIWMRGDYTTYVNYDTNLVGISVAVPEPGLLSLLAMPMLTLLRRRRKTS